MQMRLLEDMVRTLCFVESEKYRTPNAKYTYNTGRTRNKLLEQWVHLTNHTAGHSRPGTTHLAA